MHISSYLNPVFQNNRRIHLDSGMYYMAVYGRFFSIAEKRVFCIML